MFASGLCYTRTATDGPYRVMASSRDCLLSIPYCWCGKVCSPYPIDKKFEAFNFHVINVDAHDFDALRAAFKEARETKGMPTCIVVHSLKGKGVSFMENSVDWHGKAPNDEEYAVAMADLEKIGAELEKAGEA